MRTRLAQILVVLLAVSIVAAGCAPAAAPSPTPKPVPTKVAATSVPPVAATKKPIKIGAGWALTGAQAYMGQIIQHAHEMAVEELNASGGIYGHPVEIVFRDDGGDAKQAAVVAHEFADDPDLIGVVGFSCSGATLAGIPILNEARLACSTAALSYELVTQGYDNIFQIGQSTILVGESHADAAYHLANARSAAILYIQDPCNEQYAQGFRERCQELGIEITSDQAVTMGGIDFRPVLTKIRDEDPDVVFGATFAEKALIVKQMRELGMQQPYVATELIMFSGEFIPAAGDAAVGSISGQPIPPPGHPAVAEYMDEYEERWGQPCETDTAQNQQAMDVLIDAIKRAYEKAGDVPSREAVIEAMHETDYEGAYLFPVYYSPEGVRNPTPFWFATLQPDRTFGDWQVWDPDTGTFSPYEG